MPTHENKKPLALQAKLNLVILCASVIMICISIFIHKKSWVLHKQQHILHSEERAKIIEHSIRKILIQNSTENQNDLTNKLEVLPNIISIEILDKNKKKLFSYQQKAPHNSKYNHQFLSELNPKPKGISYPGMASIHLHLDTLEELDQNFHRSIYFVVIFTLILMIVSTIAIHLFLKAPLKQLYAALDQSNDLPDIHLSDNSHSLEIIQVANKIQDMLDKIAHQNIEVRQARDKALLSEQVKSNFLAIMSHELRTPLNGIIGMAEILKSTTLTHEQSELLTIMRKSGDTLLELIQRILKYSRIASGHMDFHEQTHNFKKFLYDLNDITEQQIYEKKITLKFDPDESLPEFLIYDENNLRTVLEAILLNAVKFTKAGIITFNITSKQLSSDKCLITFNISDTGIGMSPETLKEIYTPFKQQENGLTRQQGGIGIGLTLAHIILKHLDSEIYVDSDLDQGSHFHFSLEMQQAKPSQS